ncbi:hypothetical protein CECT5772_04401 [Streptococcus equi subsp. ruminatorum CECT 5772]|uniref:Uncharacterized protein n=1 Tax=Streptococcus equi subsp. ruminatorum CECT 5772 TaxID=1051981 RepID=A0A922T6H9_9STRE|nr:hypothetical protein CECT5772_04401 [Streptococcus equi subsp. ruminatorum CECT 5772]
MPYVSASYLQFLGLADSVLSIAFAAVETIFCANH